MTVRRLAPAHISHATRLTTVDRYDDTDAETETGHEDGVWSDYVTEDRS